MDTLEKFLYQYKIQKLGNRIEKSKIEKIPTWSFFRNLIKLICTNFQLRTPSFEIWSSHRTFFSNSFVKPFWNYLQANPFITFP